MLILKSFIFFLPEPPDEPPFSASFRIMPIFRNNYIIVTEESLRKTDRIPWVCKNIGV